MKVSVACSVAVAVKEGVVLVSAACVVIGFCAPDVELSDVSGGDVGIGVYVDGTMIDLDMTDVEFPLSMSEVIGNVVDVEV